MKTTNFPFKVSVLPIVSLFFLLSFSIPVRTLAIEPLTPSSLITFSVTSCNEVDISWVQGDGFRRLVVGSVGVPVSSFPVDGVSYVAGSIFGSGSNLGNNNYVVYSATGNNVTVTTLNANKTYYFAIFEYNGTGGSSDYLTSIYPEADTIPFGVSIQIVASDTILCNGASVTLDASGANSYTWSPPSGLSGTSGPSVTASPSATTRYSVLGTDLSGCQAYERITLTVNPRPTVTLANQPSSCIDDNDRVLTGGSPSGGVYSGPGVSGGMFDPSAAGTGFHTITYTYTNAQGCSSAATKTITVYGLPTVTLSNFPSRCFNAGEVTLSGGNPSGGTYSGPGITAGVFDPAAAGVGTHTVTYNYSDSHGCSSSATSSIVVNPAPTVTLASFNVVCINTAAFPLTGGSPSGGLYSGTGVSAGNFDPSVAGVGTHTISYRFTNAQGCSDSATATIQVGGLPAVTLNPFSEVCLSAASFTLSGGNPLGGVFSGDGVSSNVFSPSVADTGSHVIVYTYTNANGCVNSASSSITVNPAPTVSIGTFNDVCANTGPVSLTSGMPSGGIYSGTAVAGTTFYTGIAGPGTFTINYTVTDSNSCSATASQSINVRPVPVVNLGPDSTICMDMNIVLNAGPGFSSYAWNTGSNSQTITVDTTGRGTGTFSFRVSVSSIYGCVGKDTVEVTIDICTGLDEVGSARKDFMLYPNPFSTTFQLESEEMLSLFVYDQTGRLLEIIENRNGTIHAGKNLATGIYLVEIRTKDFSKAMLMVKTD
ncbi:MAG: T9SS type A sorting domain-containing protein [Bacteroidetes bacterium]|nr:MAG: T9SS type A sorting domain-containing protein [Bacteroidota bacterium]